MSAQRSKRGIPTLVTLGALIVAQAPVDASPSVGDGPVPPGVVLPPVPKKAGASQTRFDSSAVTRVRPGRRNGTAPEGTLRGKTVYVSAGHGYYYDTGLGAWATQRGNTHDLVEDFITAETVAGYLIPYLQAMGAYVVPIRESDMNRNLVVVDETDTRIEGTLAEVADAAGWGPLPMPYTGSENPFARGRARAMISAASETGRVVYPTAVPTSAFYNVYISYVQGADRVSDAHVTVRHAGGESRVRIDQRRHGSTWMLLGRWYFEAGAPVERSSIVVSNESAEANKVISFDAVRLGGGMGPHVRGGVTTMRPAYETAARYSTQLLGAPASVYGPSGDERQDDVGARPRFAAWEHEAGEDAVYLAVHTNAPSPQRGTLSLAYGNTYPCCAPLSDFAGTAGSLELLGAVHDEMIADLRAGWDPQWQDRNKMTAQLGELRPSSNGEMPAILVEIAFHDTELDADALRDPRFRRIAARAMAQGVAKFFATKDGRALVLPPEPVTALRVENAGDGTLRVSWRAPEDGPGSGDAPTRYRVHLSENGYGFDDGVVVDGESYDITGLAPDSLHFVRVTAVNDGGEAPPSEVVAARVSSGKAPVLLVGGFDRFDASQMTRDVSPAPLGELDRMWLERMNNGTYAVPHAKAIAGAGYAFDSATDDAIEAQDIDLTAYKAIDWFVGEDAGDQKPLSATARIELQRFFLSGGGLLISGSELVWALQSLGNAEDEAFASMVLHANLAADDANTYDVVPEGELFADLGPFSFEDNSTFGYEVAYPDVLVPQNGATTVLAYGTGGAAGIAWNNGDSRGIVLGFPLETIVDDGTRTELIARAFASFGLGPDNGDEDTGCCSSNGSANTLPGLLVLGLVVLRRRRR
ncbi:MAG: fibronectin type III domain-containing protein [Kofleriaceae bacterium]|nr:fibronectin type III domain-containing protein [Kofleriaceae bacterium]